MDELLSTKLCDLKPGEIQHPRYRMYFSDKPFKSLNVGLKSPDKNELFIFSCFQGSCRWLCGMMKTSFYSSRLYEQQFDENKTVQDVIEYVDSVLIQLRDVLNNNLSPAVKMDVQEEIKFEFPDFYAELKDSGYLKQVVDVFDYLITQKK